MGTFLSGIYGGKHSEKVSAYITISQMLDFMKSEEVSAEDAIRLANGAGKTQDGQEIREKLALIMTYRKFDKLTATQFLRFRQLKDNYLPSGDTMSTFETISRRFLSPYMTFSDLKWMFNFGKLIESNSKRYDALLSEDKLSMYDYNLQYEIPVIMIAGDCVGSRPTVWLFITSTIFLRPIKNTGPVPFADNPKEFSEGVLNALREV